MSEMEQPKPNAGFRRVLGVVIVAGALAVVFGQERARGEVLGELHVVRQVVGDLGGREGRRAVEPASHDHLFHSILGVLDVGTPRYRPERDLFGACRTPG